MNIAATPSPHVRVALRRFGIVLALAAGTAAGLAFALPLDDAAGRCPPAGEGQLLCELQRIWVPAVVTVAFSAMGAVVLLQAVTSGIPRMIRAAIEHRRNGPELKPDPPFGEDPVLVAATWGVTYGEEAVSEVADQPSPEPVVPVPSRAAPPLVEPEDRRERIAAIALALDLGRFMAIDPSAQGRSQRS